MMLKAHIERRWSSFEQRHFWTLQGTGSVLDGTVLATHFQREPFTVQARTNLAEINRRRQVLGLPRVALNERRR